MGSGESGIEEVMVTSKRREERENRRGRVDGEKDKLSCYMRRILYGLL